MTTRTIKTRSMLGNKDADGVIFDLLTDLYGMSAVCNHEIDFCDGIYSDGFIHAIKSGIIPTLNFTKCYEANICGEYHHVISNNECYRVYFI